MHLLVVVGAGASFDCWPEHVRTAINQQKLPLANDLFSTLPTQGAILNEYNLMGLASRLRKKEKASGKSFDVEAELATISKLAEAIGDKNTIQSLFKARFYIHRITNILTKKTLSHTNSHTVYVDLLNQLKEWIDQSPTTRFVDIVVFNYDNLIEKAMETVYNYDWRNKTQQLPLNAYFAGNNMRIYKPHGSINWGREILKNGSHFSYGDIENVFREFDQLELAHGFQFIDPDVITDPGMGKIFIPAIAVPFKTKTNFDECPQGMQVEMLKAIKNANKIITLGWKGADENFTSLLSENDKIDEIYVVSPRAETQLNKALPMAKLTPIETTFSCFVSDTVALEGLLSTFDKK